MYNTSDKANKHGHGVTKRFPSFLYSIFRELYLRNI